MEDTTEKKPRGCLKGCLITLAIFVVVVVLGVLGVRMYFNNNIPEPVEYEMSDVDSFYEKANINKEDYEFSVEDLLKGNLVGQGEVEVDALFTSEELTGFLQSKDGDTAMGYQEEILVRNFENILSLPLLTVTDGKASELSGTFFLTDFNVRAVGEDQLEVYANVSNDLDPVYELIPSLERYRTVVDRGAGSLIYVKLEILHSTDNGFDITMLEIRANGIPVPQRFIDAYQDDLNRVVNREVNQAEILKVYEFKIEADGIRFVGILPEKLKSLDY